MKGVLGRFNRAKSEMSGGSIYGLDKRRDGMKKIILEEDEENKDPFSDKTT